MQTNNFSHFANIQNRKQMRLWLPIVAAVLLLLGFFIPYLSRTTFLLDSTEEIFLVSLLSHRYRAAGPNGALVHS